MKLVSFFSGCGGMDLGFEQAGFDVAWANEFDSSIRQTYRFNHSNTFLCGKDIRDVDVSEIPDCDGFIGGPLCQSWSTGGSKRGLNDSRGKVFLDYIRLIKGKRPKFFVIENVAGIISDHHFVTFHGFLSILSEAGYKVQYAVLNTSHFGIPQERLRVIVVGIRNSVLVGYFKNKEHLHEILKNKIYYVRTGFRKGAMQISPGTKQPNYLLLHHGEEKHLYELKDIEPLLRTSDYLKSLGFHPSGDVYLCFELKSCEEINQPAQRIELENEKEYSPYIIGL